MIKIKRVYEPAGPEDGARFLVDRLWPRGIRREALEMTAWLRDASPSTALRNWFGHDPARWEEFLARYFAELDAHPEAWRPIVDAAQQGDVTLIYAAREMAHNNAVALRTYLLDHAGV